MNTEWEWKNNYNKLLILLGIIVLISSCSLIYRPKFMDKIGSLETLRDGVYEGSNFNILCWVKVKVTIEDGYIKDIKILDKFSTWPPSIIAYKKIPRRIIRKQSLDVDSITGATVSCNNIKAAVLDALKKAE